MFKNTFSFKGRIRRTEYGIDLIIYITIILFINFVADILDAQTNGLLITLYILPTWFLVAQGTKRSHDIGRSGWWQLIPFFAFFLLFKEGEDGKRPSPSVVP